MVLISEPMQHSCSRFWWFGRMMLEWFWDELRISDIIGYPWKSTPIHPENQFRAETRAFPKRWTGYSRPGVTGNTIYTMSGQIRRSRQRGKSWSNRDSLQYLSFGATSRSSHQVKLIRPVQVDHKLTKQACLHPSTIAISWIASLATIRPSRAEKTPKTSSII